MKQKVVFVRDEEVTAQGKVAEKFKEGKTYELDEGSAQRWLRRGACVLKEDFDSAAAAKKAKKAADKNDAKDLDAADKNDGKSGD